MRFRFACYMLAQLRYAERVADDAAITPDVLRCRYFHGHAAAAAASCAAADMMLLDAAITITIISAAPCR